VQGASKKRKVGSTSKFIPLKQSKKTQNNPVAFMSSSMNPTATVHTAKISHTLVHPSAMSKLWCTDKKMHTHL